MISGGYLPDILYGTLQTAEPEGLLPAGAVRLPRLTMAQFDALLEGRLPAGFAGGCGAAFCCALADGILQRAALFAASMLAAAAARSTPAQGEYPPTQGKSPAKGIPGRDAPARPGS